MQTIGVPVHAPALQVSLMVQAFPSSQSAPSTNWYSQRPPAQAPIRAWHAVGGVLQGPQALAPAAPPPLPAGPPAGPPAAPPALPAPPPALPAAPPALPA